MTYNGKITDRYLPSHHYGRLEGGIAAVSTHLAAPFIPPEEVEEQLGLRLACAPIADCIGNLTARFPDGPTYFVVVRSSVPTAMVFAFGDFQCLVFSEALHAYFSFVGMALFNWPPLRAFALQGGEPHDDNTAPTRTRREAINHLINEPAPVENEARAWTATVGYFVMYFLTAHELGHIALGHLQPKAAGQAHMAELEDGESSKDLLQSRALEWEADGFAALAAVWHTAALREQGHDAWADHIKDGPGGVRVFMIGAYILFSIMDWGSQSDRPAHLRTHPAPMVRVSLTALMLTVAIELLGAVSGEQVQEETRRSIKAVEIALNEVAGGMMSADEAKALGEEAFDAVDGLFAALTEAKATQDRSRLKGYFWARMFEQRPTDGHRTEA